MPGQRGTNLQSVMPAFCASARHQRSGTTTSSKRTRLDQFMVVNGSEACLRARVVTV